MGIVPTIEVVAVILVYYCGLYLRCLVGCASSYQFVHALPVAVRCVQVPSCKAEVTSSYESLGHVSSDGEREAGTAPQHTRQV